MPSATTRAKTALSHESCRSNPACRATSWHALESRRRRHDEAAAGEIAGRRADHHGYDRGREGARARARDPDLEGRAHRVGERCGPAPAACCAGASTSGMCVAHVPVTCLCTASYATGRCPSSSHSTSQVAWGSSTHCAPSGTPATPRRRSTPGCPAWRAGAMLDALRPTRIVASDGEQHALPDGQPVEEGDALVVTTSGTSGQPKGVVLTHEAVAASAHATTGAPGHRPVAPLVACLLAAGAHRRPVRRDACRHHRHALAGAARLRGGHGRSGGPHGARLARRARGHRVTPAGRLRLLLRAARRQQGPGQRCLPTSSPPTA